MAVRPPQGDDDSPETLEFGIAALNARLDQGEVRFPATTEELVEGLDDPEIPVDGASRTVRLSTVLSELRRDEFESETQLLDMLHPVFERKREEGASGFIGRLRAILPF